LQDEARRSSLPDQQFLGREFRLLPEFAEYLLERFLTCCYKFARPCIPLCQYRIEEGLNIERIGETVPVRSLVAADKWLLLTNAAILPGCSLRI